MANTRVILASQSIGRRKLLEKLGIPFTVMPADLDEDAIVDPDPLETTRLRARAKATHTLKTINSSLARHSLGGGGSTLIIAADTMVIYNGKLYSKPTDKDDARRLLKELIGNTHQAVTHTVIVETQGRVPSGTPASLHQPGTMEIKEIRRWDQTMETQMTMNPLSDEELEAYLNRYDLTRFAGCYSLDEAPWNLFRKIDGSYTNVIGLPFEVILPIFSSLSLI